MDLVVCCQLRTGKEEIVRRILEGYDTDVEPPVSEDSNTTVFLGWNILCASAYESDAMIEAWLRMVCSHARSV